ncbi:MAG: multicopper oxidase domain-containing protein [Alphaproteobacteria bacterium]|nr:multicopper oxidase domain-containing protein [Alphaproteobacteria bacterium]
MIDPLVVRNGDRAGIPTGGLKMTNQTIHLHGFDFVVTGPDGCQGLPTARWPEVGADIPVAAMRAIKLTVSEPSDWAIHCHKSHHTTNFMGHYVPTMIGVDHRDMVHKITNVTPDYMVIGERGMADMQEKEMLISRSALLMVAGRDNRSGRSRWSG